MKPLTLPYADWMEAGLCGQTSPDDWFPPKGGSIDRPRAICRQCPVRRQCLAYAMEIEAGEAAIHRHGIWGGLTPRQRARLAEGEAA